MEPVVKRRLTTLLFTSLLAMLFFSFSAIANTGDGKKSAVDRALEQSLSERAKSHREFERNASAGRPQDSAIMRKQQREERVMERGGDRQAARERKTDQDLREARAQYRDSREESRREKRLNWLKD